jgi:flavin reductase (DIM6/NTAB) family NADH-FMN oxidoreductase RutF
VDLIESKLQDAGYPLGFETIRTKFKPTAETLEQCEHAGAEFARTLSRSRKVRIPRQAADAQTDRTGQAVGRVTGSLCVVTAKPGGKDLGFLTSWVSQAAFNPPAITLAISKDIVGGYLAQPGEPFVLNILKEGRNLRRYFQKAPMPGEDPFVNVATQPATNGCLVLVDALAFLECTVQDRMDCGDHYLLYALVDNGKVLEATGVTAVSHRKSGAQY